MQASQFKTEYIGKIHVLACPKARRAARLHEEAVFPAINFVLKALNGKIKLTEDREPGAYRIGGEVSFMPENCDLRKQPGWELIKKTFHVNTQRSSRFNNEVVMLISKWSRHNPADFDRALNLAAPLHLV